MTSTRLWTLLFWTGSLLVGLASLRALVLPVDLAMPALAHYPAGDIAMWVHIIGAPIALILAPMQLWSGLRRRRPGLHRWVGRAYAAAFILSSLASLGMMANFAGSPLAAASFSFLAVISIAFTVLGVAHARAGRIAQHRRWMLRSVALAFAAVTLRVLMAPLMLAGWTVLETYDITSWLSWMLNLAVLEWWLRRRRSHVVPLAS